MLSFCDENDLQFVALTVVLTDFLLCLHTQTQCFTMNSEPHSKKYITLCQMIGQFWSGVGVSLP